MRSTFLPYNLPSIGDEETSAVVSTLRSGWLTTGPRTKEFEAAFACYAGSPHAVATNSCTAGLHVALAALGIGPGDEVITSTFTFCSTAHVILQVGAVPVLADISRDDLCLDPAEVERKCSPRTKAIIPVHYGGQPCQMDALLPIAAERGLRVVEDAAHAVGASYKNRMIGSLGDATVFSFYATKNLTTGEGGMVTTADGVLAEKMACWALHGISHDAWQRYRAEGSWFYEVVLPGFKYNMTDIQAAMGLAQLAKMDGFVGRRAYLAALYDEAFQDVPEVRVPPRRADSQHAWHLYPIQLELERLRISRAGFIEQLQRRKIGSSVHFIPVHLHPYYRERFGFRPGDFPVAEDVYERTVSLPLYPLMSNHDLRDVVEAVAEVIESNRI